MLQHELKEWWGDEIKKAPRPHTASVLVQMFSSGMASPGTAPQSKPQHAVPAVTLMPVLHWLISPETLWLGGSAR